jgi:hypothetical protein
MQGGRALGGSSTYSTPADANEMLGRIDRSTQALLRWVKVLLVAVVILIALNLLFFV